MSCIRFSTRAQHEQLQSAGATPPPTMLTPEQAASRHPVPAVTESKLRRLRLLAADADPKIRESVASSMHAPDDVRAVLAEDPDENVRACLARNASVAPDILRRLAYDESEKVRGWLAVNPLAPADSMRRLAADPSDTVRALVVWSAEHAHADG